MASRRAQNLSRARKAARVRAGASASIADGEGAPYVGASRRRSMRYLTSSGDADSVLLRSLPELRDKSDDAYRNSPAARAAIKRMVAGAVGPGLIMRSTPDRKFLGMDKKAGREWADAAERLFRLFASSKECSLCRQMTFGEIQNLAFSSQKRHGDCFLMMPWTHYDHHLFDLHLELIEAARVCNPDDQEDDDEVAGGIKRDARGVPEGIYVRSVHPGNDRSREIATWNYYPFYGAKTGRRQVLRLMEFERIDQSRGEPVLAPVLETVKQVTRFSEAELSSAVVNAILTVFVKRPTDFVDQVGRRIALTSPEQRERWENTDFDLGAGTWIEGAPGEELQTVAANRPSSQFDNFYAACMKQIGMAVGVPYEVLVQNFQSSYSASRAALLEFYKTAKIERNWLKVNLCQVVYEELITEAVIKGYISAPGFLADPLVRAAYCQTDWIGPSMGQIDPLKEAQAAALRKEYMLSTGGREAAEHSGMDFEQIVEAQEEERDAMREAGFDVSGGGRGSKNAYPSDDDSEE